MLGTGLFNTYDPVNVWANDSAVYLDGGNDYAEIVMPLVVSNGVRSSFTLSLWVKSDSATINADFVIWYHVDGNTSNNAEQYLWYDESEEKIKFTRTDEDGLNPATSEMPQSKTRMAQWSHVAVSVIHDGDMKIFVNTVTTGSTVADSPGAWGASIAKMYYGVNKSTNDDYFNGYINNVAIWNENFGGGAITEIYNQGRPKNELESYPASNIYFYHVSNEKHFSSDTGYQIATFGVSLAGRILYSGAIVVSKPA